jgi:uncharacterized protein (DUF302 family)
MTPISTHGLVTRPSRHSVDDTVTRLKALLEATHVTVFALVDHSGEAGRAGLSMPPTKLLIVGNPKAGTPLVLATPSCAIDLPMKILVAQDVHGEKRLSYNTGQYLEERHGIPRELLGNVTGTETIIDEAGS